MDRLKAKFKILILSVFILNSSVILASDSFFYKELNLVGGYSSQKDFSGLKPDSSVGFEYYKKFSNTRGDYLTSNLQVRVAYDSGQRFEDSVSIEVHNAWLEYKIGSLHKIIFGHFSPYFGLEPYLDTHATLMQTLAFRNIGFKKDWGIGLRWRSLNYDYNISCTLGSGMSIREKDNSFLIAARVGVPSSREFQYGLSLLYGNILMSEGMSTIPNNNLLSDSSILKKRVGLDFKYLFGSYVFKSEVSFGEDEDENVIGYLLETDYITTFNQNLQFKGQIQSWINDYVLYLGAEYKISQKSTLRINYRYDIYNENFKEDRQILMQYYYLGA